MLALWAKPALAQDPEFLVCAGDTGIVYAVEGWENSTFEWTVEGGEIVRHLGDSIVVNWYYIPGIYTMTVQETSEYGCSGEMKTARVEVTGPSLILGDDTYVCEGEVFEVSPDGIFESIVWHDGSTNPSFETGEEGWIVAEVSDQYGCTLKDSLYLAVEPLPMVDLGNDTVLCGSEELVLDAGPDGDFYQWSNGDIGQTTSVFMNDGPEVWVIVEDGVGCVNSDTMRLGRCDLQYYFRDIPSAITPNGDGANDYWEIDKLEAFSNAVIDIYSQWGTLVWKSEPGYSVPWDGNDMSGRSLPVDSYHFVIHINDGSGDEIVGIVTIIR